MRGFCKYHSFLAIRPHNVFFSRILCKTQSGRLKFGDKTKSQMNIDSDPLQVADAHYLEPFVVNMVEVFEVHDRNAMMFETTEGFK